ncbi:sulfur-carrier protein [Cupriavidus metallidurans]|jgi:sulfur-carrier protein|uniref:Molybdopterin synthase, small subunit n=2 Tax=Cupriavidus metallidurans TaxID=119219 RepID=Q1LLY4_CUPMC|nr:MULTISPECIES: molybdopterin converting factor subunit 1 [Cupriavidus]ABF08842.1 molybdopterin synthase, small subunit [Cupriavidus metallidurans CH34]AVA36082.1 molybdopterin converting factor subunit 1 [Cupriavidus metallidurans]KWR81996.1 molybdopterin synthase sulfur carrier subunit [Cupriavidus sp. SHE]KWW37840.1 Molybdopterin synthase sulfur carrier subunit [Cupriavidus metallidurans]MDE4918232.1 molybdopterin converting factor subunit 1 [Cupriavidus metallidurans]
MQLELRYFASVREQVGQGAERAEVPAEVRTVGDLRAWLRGRGGAWTEALADGRALRMAVDHAVARADTPLADGCEVAFFPPVTGG